MGITTKYKIKAKQRKKISNYFELNVEIDRLWKMTEKIIKVTPSMDRGTRLHPIEV